MRLTCNDIIYNVHNYYPFGGIIDEGSRRGADVQNHLYNGKELDRMHGLNLYDYSARQDDAAIGQFTSMDPLCEKYYHISSYAYCAGNPVKYVDPDGRIPLKKVVPNTIVTSKFGTRKHPVTGKVRLHGGCDLRASKGSPVHVLADGKVIMVRWNEGGYGRYVVVQHDKGYQSLYAHLEKDGVKVNVGDVVKNGQVIASSGNTGIGTGPHLHVEISNGNILNRNNKMNPESIEDLQNVLNGTEDINQSQLEHADSSASSESQESSNPQNQDPERDSLYNRLLNNPSNVSENDYYEYIHMH